ncbi:hypothetical protein CVT25_003495 [Psilocybe cyanescens]|uniref:Uncharacterized protein n=1 Tax=Psilocybe cyanescens TaxID=93625 RepID=A0A409X4T2_PSICY|nr:hypothetical protein CVT25_003495 [Psilocybe cyanescens]
MYSPPSPVPPRSPSSHFEQRRSGSYPIRLTDGDDEAVARQEGQWRVRDGGDGDNGGGERARQWREKGKGEMVVVGKKEAVDSTCIHLMAIVPISRCRARGGVAPWYI